MRAHSSSLKWYPLATLRLGVQSLDLVNCIPKFAKDEDYAREIQTAWRREISSDWPHSEASPFPYKDAEGTPCFGHIIRTKRDSNCSVPGVLVFHTGAGPHDLFLHWKADALATNMQVFPEGCVVLIADILSDDSGWAWNPDRSKYDAARQHVLEADGQGTRRRLRNRIEAALAELSSFPNVDSSRLGAMGWCLGGQSILEMARMKSSGVKAMVTFHGVFDGAPPPTNVDREEEGQGCQILVCNGEQDPFVSKESLDNAIQTMEQFGHKVTLLQLEGAKHGFSSPAQDFNPNIAFGYNEQAAVKSWSATLDLLKSSF